MNYAGRFDATISSDGQGGAPHSYFHVDSVQGHAPADAIVVPDAHFLFHADFKRSGLDLVLHSDDRELVLHNYFKGDKHPALASPDGAHLTADLVNALTGSVDVAQAGGPAAGGQVIGHVTKLVGNATVVRNGVSIILNMGDNVEKGDVVQSGSDSTLGITFIDGTVFGLSANARMVLNEMVYDPNGSNNSSLLSLVAGTITFVAGETAKHGDMKVDTPVATMGIRGTAVLVEIDFTVPGQGATPDAHFQVLVEPDGTTGSYILFDKTTLQPLAVVNQAGQQINISNGVISQSSAPLSPDVEKLIQDVFTLKFSANDTNPKTTTAQTDTTNPLLYGPPIKLANGTTATPVYQQAVLTTSTSPTATGPDISGPTNNIIFADHAPFFTSGPQSINFSGGQHTTGGSLTSTDPLSGLLGFSDIDLGDTHTLALDMSAVMSDGEQISTGLQTQFKNALTVSLASDSSSTGIGLINWQLSELPVYLADFIPAGQTLTLTYTITVTDSHLQSAEQTVTVTIAGTEQPAVVWIATTTGEPTGGSWNDAANWETKTVPTANDDVIVITNQLIGLTPNYPVKVDSKDAAAHSVTMNDFSDTPPELDILSGAALTVGSAKGGGSGGIFLNSDSKLHIFGTLTLENGGNFADQSQVTIDAGGLLEVAGGTLTASFDISNLGQFTVDKGTVLTLNSATIDGGDAQGTLSISGTLNLEGASVLNNGSLVDAGQVNVAGTVVFDNEAVTNNGSRAIDITGTLNIAGSSQLQGGELDNTGSVNVSGSGVVFDGEAVINTHGGAIDITGALTLSGNSFVSGGLVTNDGTLTLAGNGAIESGRLDNEGQFNVTGSENAMHDEQVTANNALEVMTAAALLVDQGTTITNSIIVPGSGEDSDPTTIGGTITVDNSASLTVNDATIAGGTVTNNDGGTIDLTGAAVIESGAFGNFGQLNVSGTGNLLDGDDVTNTGAGNIDITGALTLQNGSSIVNGDGNAVMVESEASLSLSGNSFLSGGLLTNDWTVTLAGNAAIESGQLDNEVQVNVTGTANALHDEQVTANNALEVMTVAALLIDQGTTITNSITVPGSGEDSGPTTIGGNITVDESASLTVNDATIAGGTVTVDVDGILALTGGGAQLEQGALLNSGQLNISGSGNELYQESITNSFGNINVTGQVAISGGSISGGTLTNQGTVVTAVGAGDVTFDGLTVDNAKGAIQIGGLAGNLVLDDGTTITGGSVTIAPIRYVQAGLEISGSAGAMLSGVTLGSYLLVDAGSTLVLKQTNAQLTAKNYGTIEIADSSTIHDSSLDFGKTIINSGKTLGLDNTIVGGESFTNRGTILLDTGKTLSLFDTAIDGGLVTNDGTLVLTSGISPFNNGSVIKNGSLDNEGQLNASGIGSVLDGEAVRNAGDGAIDITGALTLKDGASITNGESNALTVETKGSLTLNDTSSIAGGALSNAGNVYVEASAGATLDGVSVENASGTIHVDGAAQAATLILDDGTTITGGHLDIGDVGTLEVSTEAGATLSGVSVDNSHLVHVDEGAVLALDGSTIDNGALVNDGTINSSGISAIDGADITNDGVIEVLSGTLTIDPGTLSNSSTLQADGGELDISGETVDNTGIVGATGGGVLKLFSSTIDNSGGGAVAVDAGSTLELDHSGISGGTISISGTLDNLAGINTITSAIIEIGSGSIVVSGGSLDLAGAVAGNVTIAGDSTLELSASAASAYAQTTVTFAAGASGTLVLDHAESFAGTIAGLDDNSIDLADISYGSSPTVSYANGVLSVFVGGVDVANLDLAGNYSGVHWVLADDGTSTHGTSLTEAPGAISGLDANGNADQGTAVSVSITDGGAAVADAKYDWQVSTDGVHWTEAGGNNGASTYTPVEADEGQSLRVSLSFTDSAGNAETSSVSAGVVQEIAGGDLVATLDSATALQGTTIQVMRVTDGDVAVSDVTYDWQVSSDGTHWTEANGTNGQSSYTPVEADEGLQLRLVTTLASDPSGPESTTNNLGVVGEITGGDLVTTLSATSAAQGSHLYVIGVADGDAAVTAGLTYSWQVSSDGTSWTQVSNLSYYDPTEQDEGKSLKLVTTYAEPSGGTEQTTNLLGKVADVVPTLLAPFSFAVDELKVVKNGSQVFDDNFAQPPPVAGTFGTNPVSFLTNGSTWSDVGGKGIMSSTGVYALPTVNGAEVLARLNTNTQDDSLSGGGLKENATFAVSAVFDLTVPQYAGQQYAIALNDSSATHANDEMVQLTVSADGHGGVIVKLVQADFATTTFTTIASQDLSAAQIAGSNQIELDLSHLTANTTDITGSFALLNDGSQTLAQTFGTTGHVFDNTTYTRAEIFGFGNTGVVITGQVQQGQTLTANTTTNDSDATINYQWQHSSDGVHWSDIGTNSATYLVQESDEGFKIHVIATTSDPDSSQPPATATSAATAVVQDVTSGDLVVALNSTAALQGTAIHVTGVTDGGVAVADVTYDWQVSTDGIHWSEANGANGQSSYTPIEADEGLQLQLVTTLANDPAGPESTTNNLGVVGEAPGGDLAVTLTTTSAAQGAQITVATVTDGGVGLLRGATGLSYSWEASSNGTDWTQVGSQYYYVPTEQDEGKSLKLVTTYAEPGGGTEQTTNLVGTIADIAPTLLAPFTFAVDELKVVKNGSQVFDDNFAQAPPFAGTFEGSPVSFLTEGSIWSDVGGKGIMSSTGVYALPTVNGAELIARLNTNTQDEGASSAGLKENATFTVSATFDLAAPPNSGDLYGINLQDQTATHPNDEMVQLYVQSDGHGGAVVKLVQADFATTTFTTIASETLTADQLAHNTQIELDLAHLTANSTDITGSFELLNNGSVTSTQTFGTTGHVFDNTTYTRADIFAFGPTGVVIAGQAQQGQTLTANTTTNESDATINYQWQHSSDGVHWSNIGTNSATYLVQESDEGFKIHVIATTSDPDSSQAPATATSAATGIVQEIAGGDLVVALSSATAQQGTAIHVTDVTDGGVAVSDVTYDWQVSTDGIHWSEANGTNGQSSYTPVEADGGSQLRLVTTLANDPSGPESTTNDLGLVSQGDNDVVTTLNASTAQQGAQITVTGVTDDGQAVSNGVSYSWEVSPDGTQWTQVSTNSYYAPTEQDEGRQLRLVTSYVEPSGQTDQTVNDLGTVADITPTLVAPFSFAVDEMKIVKNHTTVFDDSFAQAPPVAGTFGNSAVQFITQGSTWTDVGGKGIMSASGVQTLPTVDGAQVLARLGTNNQDEGISSGGLKENAAFTVSTTFDLTVPQFAGQQYGIDLNDSAATHGNDEMVELYVVGDGHGGATVKLVQADFATTTFTTLASQVLDPDQLAGNNQIELDLAHPTKNTSAITGSFELLNEGSVTASQTFEATGHVFNNTTYTRADIFAFAPTAVVITGEAQQGQTLKANTVTNEADAAINYEWQHSTDGVNWTDIGSNSATYVVQDSDQGFKIHVIASTADGDNSHAPATATSAATALVPITEPAPVISQAQSFATGTINSNGVFAPQVGNEGSSLQLTDTHNSEAASWFAANKVSVDGFHASFDYQGANDVGGTPADGVAFVLQDSPEGTHALGGAGGFLGYGGDPSQGDTPISQSAAVELNLYYGYGQGTNLAVHGNAFSYNSTLPVDFWTTGDKIHVDLAYDGDVLTETLTDLVTQQTYTATYATNLGLELGSTTGYVGFSGGTGAADANQTVSNYVFEQTANYNAGDAPVAVDPTLTLSDPGVATLAHATVQITGNLQANEDVLAFDNNDANAFGNITAVYTASSGTLELTSAGDTATLAQWQNALDAVTYTDTNANPTLGMRAISFQVDNGNGANNLSNVQAAQVDVIKAPTVDLGDASTFTNPPDDLQYAVFPNISIDDRGQGIDHASVTWTGALGSVGFVGLTWGPNNTIDGITVHYDSVTGGYDFSGEASVESYDYVLSHLAYNSWQVHNGTTFTVSVGEGGSNSTPVTSTIDVAVPASWDVWTGGGEGPDWSDTGNWSLGYAPSQHPGGGGAPDYAYIDSSEIITLYLDFTGSLTLQQLHVLSGATLEITSTDGSYTLNVAGVENSDGTYAAGLHNDAFIDVQGTATLNITGNVLNDGTLEAEGPGASIVFNTGDVSLYNGSVVAFDGAEVDLIQTSVQGGQIRAYSGIEVDPTNPSSLVFLDAASLTDVELTGSPEGWIGGQFEVASGLGPTIFNGVSGLMIDAGTVVKVEPGATLQLQGAIDNSGDIVVDGIESGATMSILGHVTLQGGGVITLDGAADMITGIEGSSPTLDNVDNTIEGIGTIGGGGLTLINDAVEGTFGGKIVALAGELVIDSASITNNGSMGAEEGGTLQVGNAHGTDLITNFSADPNFAGGAVLTGGAYHADDSGGGVGSAIDFGYAAPITTLDASVELSGANSMIQSDGVALQDSLSLIGSSGELSLSGNLTNLTAPAQDFVDPNGVEVQGQLVLSGASFDAASLRIDAGAYVSADGEISTLHDGGYGELANGSTIIDVNTLELAGQIDGTGTLEIQYQATLQIDPVQAAPNNSDAQAVSVSGQTVQFDSAPDGTSPPDETLKIAGAEVDSSTFNAVIKGFALGDTIDLIGVGLADTWSFDGSTLTIAQDGTTIGSLSLAGLSADTKFDVGSDGNGGTDVTLNHPVIDTTHFSVQQNEDGTDTILGVQVSDSDPIAAQSLTISATTAGAPVSTISPSSGTGSVDDINSELASGITYNPGSPQPQTDMVNVTVSDNFGASDTVHFVFNQGGQGPNISLTGTTGNDVIFATGNDDTLTGNGGQDQFVFAPTSSPTGAQHTITDFNTHLDTIDLRQFTNINTTADALATATQQGNDTLLTVDSQDTVLLKNVIAANLHASDFIVTPHFG